MRMQQFHHVTKKQNSPGCIYIYTIFFAAKFRSRGEKLREDVHSIAARMPPEDDWFFGAEMRLEGQVRAVKLSAIDFFVKTCFKS